VAWKAKSHHVFAPTNVMQVFDSSRARIAVTVPQARRSAIKEFFSSLLDGGSDGDDKDLRLFRARILPSPR
jgi:hypothetical protein